jgi:hypothetical protein
MGLESEIRDPEKTCSGSRIQGPKRHRIPDPDPQHWLLPVSCHQAACSISPLFSLRRKTSVGSARKHLQYPVPVLRLFASYILLSFFCSGLSHVNFFINAFCHRQESLSPERNPKNRLKMLAKKYRQTKGQKMLT